MKSKLKALNILLSLLLILIIHMGCENDYPDSIYQKDAGQSNPVISSVDPPVEAWAGVTNVKITGQNFHGTPQVYFNGVAGDVLSSTSTEVIVQPPNTIGDDLEIKISAPGAYDFATYSPYSIKNIAEEFGGFDQYDNIQTIAVDKDENLYAHKGNKTIVKVTSDGEKIEHAETSMNITFSIKFGWDGSLFLVRKNAYLYRLEAGASKDERWAKIGGKLYDFDFDQNGNMYASGKSDGIYTVQSDGSSVLSTDYTDIQVTCLRVYNDYVYVSGFYLGDSEDVVKEGIWRNKILSADGQLGEKELVFDWASYVGENGATILGINFDVDGNLYIGRDKDGAVSILKTDGSMELLYPKVLEAPASFLCWGNSNYLYIYRKDDADVTRKKVFRVHMFNDGAPYYGRQL